MTDTRLDESRRTITPRVVLFIVIGLAVVAFAFDNRQAVTLGWVFGQVRAPLVLVLVGVWVTGVVAGRLVTWRRH